MKEKEGETLMKTIFSAIGRVTYFFKGPPWLLGW